MPILHGLRTYGFAADALVDRLCDRDSNRIRKMDGRFAAPVFPGETIETEIWRLGPGEASFRCRLEDQIVIDHGFVIVD